MSVFLFHVTDSIHGVSLVAEGLTPSKSREPLFRKRHLYLSNCRKHAEAYANHHGDWKGRPVTLRVSTYSLKEDLLGPDDVDLPDMMRDMDDSSAWSDHTWQQSLAISGQCTYAGVIPPSSLEYAFEGSEEWKPLTSLIDKPVLKKKSNKL